MGKVLLNIELIFVGAAASRRARAGHSPSLRLSGAVAGQSPQVWPVDRTLREVERVLSDEPR